MQKSLVGLLRAVLHTLVSGFSQSGNLEVLEKIKHMCGARWQSIDAKRAWSCKELKEIFSGLALTSDAKIFLLVDALDECEPQDRLGDLADLILWLSRLPNVKICVSCRPWAAFTKRFNKATVLRLDQLTYHDMEVYIEKRLIDAEAEADLSSAFRDGILPAKQLIYDVAVAADGVFLWVELVVNALCSEIRTGCPVDQLRLTASEFPTDLDDYFQNLIFGRIGTTRANVSRTAAALKLAMVIQDDKERPTDNYVPISQDYLNFWFLSIGHLKPGFSWTDELDPRYSAFDVEKKLRQTRAFLEETSKDLLTVHERWGSYKVAFLHRTVFDFLRENSASLPIEQHAPGHFSDQDFIINLTKLRCISRLREDGMDCRSLDVLLESVLRFFKYTTDLELHQSWLLACEEIVLENFQTRCDCLGLGHLSTVHLARLCAELGLHRYLFEPAQDMPQNAVYRGAIYEHDLLELALVELGKPGTRKATVMPLFNQALECGCDPNAHFEKEIRKTYCRKTKWERWLSSEYLRLQQRDRAAPTETIAHRDMAAKGTASPRLLENSSIIVNLLRHGADPHCMPCTTNHPFGDTCSQTALHDILQFIVPAECLSSLQNLLVSCSGEGSLYKLRRDQRRRAVRSFTVSEQKFASRILDRCRKRFQEDGVRHWIIWEHQQTLFLQSLINPDENDIVCPAWSTARYPICLFTWCVDCQSRSHACFTCPDPHFLTQCTPCKAVSTPRSLTQAKGHATVTLFFESWDLTHGGSNRMFTRAFCDYPTKHNAVYKFLNCDPEDLEIGLEAAFSVLKKWYAENPIESDSLREDNF